MRPGVEEMKMKTMALIGVAVVVLFCAGLIANVNNINKLPDPTPTPAETAAPKEKKSLAPVVAKMFDSSLGEAFGNNYTTELDLENGVFRVNTWADDTDSKFIEDAKNGGDALKVWEATVDRVIYVTSTMQSTFDETCEDPITVVTSICDPINHELPYLTVANGVAGYNVVNGVDLLNK